MTEDLRNYINRSETIITAIKTLYVYQYVLVMYVNM